MAQQARFRGYTAPVPGPMGRTDEGVDWVTKTGTAVRSIGAGVVDFVGRYSGFGNYVAYHLTEGPQKGQEIYTAEFAQPTVRKGQRIRGGQQIGIAAGGLEAGFAQRGGTYLPLAQAEGGYHEGQATAAGQRFRVLMGDSGQAQGTTLGQLWIQAGGPVKLANIMSAIALAESGGRVDAEGGPNYDGSFDYGLWQINSNHKMYDRDRLLSDPEYNAQAAVAVWRTQGLTAWSTYKNHAYLNYLTGASRHPIEGGGRVRPGGEPPGGGDDTGEAQDISLRHYLDPTQAPWSPYEWYKEARGVVKDANSFFKWIAWLFSPRTILRGVEFLVGTSLMFVGIVLAYKDVQRGGGRSLRGRRGGGILGGAVRAGEKFTPTGRALKVATKASKVAQAGEGAARARRAEETHQLRSKTEKARATELRTRGGRRGRPKKRNPIGFG